MITLDAERPASGEVLVLTCDAAGATAFLKIPRHVFGEMAGAAILAQLDDATALLRESAALRG
jgi:hypothetical protein